MAKKELKVITKDWFKNNIILFDKDFLSKKYTNIKENEKIKKQLIKIFGADFLNQIDKAGDENNLFSKKVKRENIVAKIAKMEELPSPNEADEDLIYVLKDDKAIDEDCKYHSYVVVDDEEEDTKVWLEISSPSYIFENEDINFSTKFRNFDYLFRGKYSYINWEKLKEKLASYEVVYESSITHGTTLHMGSFVYNDENKNFPTVEIWYDDYRDKLYLDKKIFEDDRDILAQRILDEDSKFKDEAKYFYITIGSTGTSDISLFGSYDENALSASEKFKNAERIKNLENISSNMLVYLSAELLDGKEYKEGTIYKYIGPKYTFLQVFEYPSDIVILRKYDGKNNSEEIGDYNTDTDSFHNRMKNLIETTDENNRTYKEYYGSNWETDVEKIKAYKSSGVVEW